MKASCIKSMSNRKTSQVILSIHCMHSNETGNRFNPSAIVYLALKDKSCFLSNTSQKKFKQASFICSPGKTPRKLAKRKDSSAMMIRNNLWDLQRSVVKINTLYRLLNVYT